MNQKFHKVIAAFLVLAFLLLAGGYVSAIRPPLPVNFNPDDVFDVYYHGGVEYKGYNFRLVEGTTFSLDDV